MEKQINGQKYNVMKEGSVSPFAFVPGGMKQIFDTAANKYILVELTNDSTADLRQLCDEQIGVIKNLREEIGNIQDELIKRDEEIIKLTAMINSKEPKRRV